jgi:hypothetical protein
VSSYDGGNVSRDAVRSESSAPGASRWRELASTAADEVRERVRRSAELSPADREKLVRRLRDVIDSALEVPPGLSRRVQHNMAELRQERAEDVVVLAWERTRRRARRTAAIGAVTTIPAVLPGLGAPLAALGLIADWRFAAEQQRDLALEIAALFGVVPDDPTEEIRALFLVSAATAFGSTAAGDALVKVLGRQIARRSVARLLPGAGAVAAGALNYVATVALGRAAIRHFAGQAGVEVRGMMPEQVHPAMPFLRNATLYAFENDAVLAGRRAPFSADDNVIIRELQPADREELLDLAVAAATAEARNRADRERVLFDIAAALGFDDDDVEEARTSTLDELSGFANRIAALVGSAGSAGGRAAQTLWRRAGRLARKGTRRIPGREQP